MPHETELIVTLTGGLTAALAFGYVARRVGLSPIVGYLLAGVAVGPFTPGFVAHAELASQLAEIGVILLMFGVGLHFHVGELLAVRKIAVPGAILQIAVATALGALIARAFGWSTPAGLIFGLSISVASTVVLTRVLADNRALHTPAGHIAVGWLIVEDLFTVLALVLLPAVLGPGREGGVAGLLAPVGLALLKLALLFAASAVVGRRLLPALLAGVAATRSRELFTLAVLVVALGIAVGSAELFGASMALGAFLAGTIVGQSELSSRAASEALPMRDAFAVLFFVSVGMLLDPSELVHSFGLTAATLAVILVGKPFAAAAVVLALRKPLHTALAVAVALAQIGEFSFILATLGRRLGVLPAQAAQVLVAASIVSITVNPLLYRYVDPVARRLSRLFEGRRSLRAGPADEVAARPEGSRRRMIVVGHGPVGRILSRLLAENGVEPVVIERNVETADALREAGVEVVEGDAREEQTLRRAGIERAASLLLTFAGPDGPAVIRQARRLAPDVVVLARAGFLAERDVLATAGASVVVSSEGEVALAMTEHVLTSLGASGEQIDRERERARAELLDASA